VIVLEGTASPTSMMSIENANTLRKVIDEVWNRGQMVIADMVFSADYVDHDPATTNTTKGPEAVKQNATMRRKAFPDLHLHIEDTISDGDHVIVRWTSTGTHTGDLQGSAPTGKSTSSTGITIARFANGKIVAEWANWDTRGLMRQLGVVK
jgi:steroid delta-isomerase-like uncharacterized protein